MKQLNTLACVVLLTGSLCVCAQSSVTSIGSLNIQKEVKPPILNIVQGSVVFVEGSGNNAIDANETSKIRLQVKNSGMGDGYGCVAKITATGSTAGLRYDNQTLSTLKMGETRTVEFPVTANMYTADGVVNFTLQIDEPDGFGTDPVYLSVNTKAFVAPMLKVVDYTVTGTSSGVLTKKQPFDLQLLLQNTQYGTADNINVELTVPEGVFIMDGNETEKFAQLRGGEKKSLVYSLIVNYLLSA